MLDLRRLARRFGMTIHGVVHVGAHYGQEFPLYRRLGAKKIVCFEPCRAAFRVLKENIAKIDCHILAFQTALGSEEGTAVMYVETGNRGASNSILKPDLHLEHYPHIMFSERETVRVATLDTFAESLIGCNLLCVDVQGYELEVFRGGADTLRSMDYIVTEVNLDSLYEGAVLLPDLDRHLQDSGFERVAMVTVHENWGDALYIKREISG